jgi:hypothetical protein
LNRFKTTLAALCYRPRLSAPDAVAASVTPLPFAPSRCPSGLTPRGPACPRSRPRHRALPSSPVAATPAVPARHAPPAAVGAARSHRVCAMPVHIAVPRPPSLCPIFSSTRRRTPNPHPSPASASKGAGHHARALFSPPHSPPPTATQASHAPQLFLPLVHTGDRAAAVLITFPTAVGLFGAALTSLILPCSSKS